jgi:Helix-turn-helix.
MSDALRIGEMVRFHRKMARLSQLELAKLAGVGKTVVFDLEHGKETVKLMTLLKLLHTLNIRLQFRGPLVEAFEKENNEKS